jgi:hypothetical protein
MDPRLQSPDAEPGPPKTPPQFIENSPILRQLFYDSKFRIGAAGFAAILAAIALSIPRIFVATPPWVQPKMRVSLLNRLQAKSLMRTAIRQADEGHIDDSVWTWQSALGLNPASADINRGMLSSLARLPDPRRKYLPLAMRQASWLLDLSATNQADLKLAVQVFERYGADDQIVKLLAPLANQMPPDMLVLLAESYFRIGDISDFAQLRQKAAPGAANDWQWDIYDAAWRWGWGPPGGLNAAKDQMHAAQKDPQKAPLAHRLSLYVNFARADMDAFKASLGYLRDQHLDHALDHANYWALLAQNGRSADAQELARKYAVPPENPAELLVIVRQMRSLGLLPEAARLVAQNLSSFSSATELWTLLADLYVEEKDWTRVRELGIDLRSDPVQRAEMPGFGWFLEGLAGHNLHFEAEARDAFEHAIDAPIKPLLVAYKTASELAALGYPDLSRKMLGRLETTFGASGDYWFRLGVAAYEMEDYRLFLTASQKAFQISPKNLPIINNLAAALILLREQPSLAVELTLKCMAAEPANSDFKINHILALLMNTQYDEAEKELKQIDPGSLPMMQVALFHFAWLQIHDGRGETVLSRKDLAEIEPRFLKAEQSKWLEKARTRLVAPTNSDSKN